MAAKNDNVFDDDDDSDDAGSEFITLRLYPETATFFADVLRFYADRVGKSKRGKEAGELALQWENRLRYAADELCDGDDTDD